MNHGEDFHAHSMRHKFATSLLERVAKLVLEAVGVRTNTFYQQVLSKEDLAKVKMPKVPYHH